MGSFDGLAHRLLGRRKIEKIPFEIGHLGPREQATVDIAGGEGVGDTEMGGHGALSIIGHHHQAPPGPGGIGRHDGRLKVHPRRRDVMGEHIAHGVIGHLPNKPRLAPKGSHAGHGVGRRSARDLDARSHRGVDGLRVVECNELHRPLDETKAIERGVIDPADHVDER